MRMFNADGSESEMCGNGVRCLAKYAFDHGLSKNNPLRVETGRGVLTLALDVAGGKVRQVTVDMGEPILQLPVIPVNPEKVTKGARDTNIAWCFREPMKRWKWPSSLSAIPTRSFSLTMPARSI